MFYEAAGKDQWLLDRRGKFTASRASELLVPGTKGALFGRGALTYIEEKAMELSTRVYEQPKLDNVKGFLHGRRFEEPAFNRYRNVTKDYDMRYFGTEEPVFLTLNKDSGGSPDGLKGQGLVIHAVLEIKCPEQPINHWKYCKFKDQWDLKEEVLNHYTQCQMLLMITKAPVCYWISFDERYIVKEKQLKIVEILPERMFQDRLEITLLQAAKERDKMIEQFLNS